MKEKIDAGQIGKPILVKFTNRDPVWKEEDLLKFSPTSGGLVFDMLTHDYDLARWLVGSDAVSVYGNGGIYQYPGLRPLGDIDNCALLVRFENGVMGFFETSRNSSYGYHVEIEIFGTKGALRMGIVPNRDRVVSYTPSGISQESVRWFFEYWEPTFQAELQHFVDCIAQEKAPEVGLEDGYKAVQWALVAREAVARGQEIRIG
jgi:myo-inositol 2-dehydrogenase/D-chiro-inositol 1-dehydrogenase